jgi:hypothetical protein
MLDLGVQRLGSSGDLRCEELVSFEVWSHELKRAIDPWIYMEY